MTGLLRRAVTDVEDSSGETQDAIAELIFKYLAELGDWDDDDRAPLSSFNELTRSSEPLPALLAD
jgi:hypothetical protein